LDQGFLAAANTLNSPLNKHVYSAIIIERCHLFIASFSPSPLHYLHVFDYVTTPCSFLTIRHP